MIVKNIDIKDIRPYIKNPRKNDKAIKTVMQSIEEYGFQQPIVVDKNNTIIVGHTRYQAAKNLALKNVPVVVADTLSEKQVNAYRIMDNRSNENSKWDDELLVEELQALLDIDTKQTVSEHTGFTESELNKLFPEAEEEYEVEVNVKKQYRSQTGDVWILGDHKLINGDSTKTEDLEKLMQDDRIDLLWEDPPYGVSYESIYFLNASERVKKEREHKIANDNLDKNNLDQFLVNHISAVDQYVKAGAVVYWCHDIKFTEQFSRVLEFKNYNVNDILIWKKNAHSNYINDYAKFYEPIIYGWKKGAKHNWYGTWSANTIELDKLDNMSKEQLIDIIKQIPSNYQFVEKETRKVASLHPTVKPVKLIVYHIINSSKQNDIVFDGFAGSGSTLLAAEKTNRRARCVELEPKFCDVIIQRWQELTGLQAYRQSDGTKWDDIETDQMSTDQLLQSLNLPDNINV